MSIAATTFQSRQEPGEIAAVILIRGIITT